MKNKKTVSHGSGMPSREVQHIRDVAMHETLASLPDTFANNFLTGRRVPPPHECDGETTETVDDWAARAFEAPPARMAERLDAFESALLRVHEMKRPSAVPATVKAFKL
jgi:hypothetical protein